MKIRTKAKVKICYKCKGSGQVITGYYYRDKFYGRCGICSGTGRLTR